MFKTIKVKKTKKIHLKINSKDSINNYECPRSSELSDMLPVAKIKKQKTQLESTEDLTVECDSNATTVLPGNVVDSRKKSKKKKSELETEHKKRHLQVNGKESINNYECSRSSDISDTLPIVKCKKQKIKLESTHEDLTVQCDSNATTAGLPGNVVEDSKKKSKKKKRKLETEHKTEEVDINIIADSVKCTIKQCVVTTSKILKKKKKEIPTDDYVNKVDDIQGIVVKGEISVDSSNVKGKKKKKKKKKGGNEIIIDELESKELDEYIGELDEESNAQYESWVTQIDSIFKKPV